MPQVDKVTFSHIINWLGLLYICGSGFATVSVFYKFFNVFKIFNKRLLLAYYIKCVETSNGYKKRKSTLDQVKTHAQSLSGTPLVNYVPLMLTVIGNKLNEKPEEEMAHNFDYDWA
jgi:hypothetical protein